MPFNVSAPAAPWRSLTRAERAAWLGGGGILALVTLMPLSATRIYTWPWSPIVAGLWLLPVAFLLVQLARAPAWRLPPPLIAAGLALFALAAVASAWASPFAGASLVRTWPTLSGAALCCLIYQWLAGQPPERAWVTAHFLGLLGAALALVSIAGWLYVRWPEPWLFRNDAPFGHANYTGGILVLLLPWIGLQACRPGAKARIGWGAIFALALLGILSSGSRGALAGMTVAGAAAFLVFLWRLSWSPGRKVILAGGLLVAMGGLALLNPRVREFVQHRGYLWTSSSAWSDRYRAWMIEAGVRLGAQRPVLGWGPGTAPLAYPQVRATLDGGVDNMLQLHNTPVQVWATLGGAGVAACGLLALGASHAASRGLKGDHVSLTATAIASLTGYGVFSLTDHQFELPIVAASAALALALLSSRGSATPLLQLGRFARTAILLHLAVLLGGPAYALTRDLRARHVYEQGVVAWENQRPAEFLTALDQAAALTPYDPFFLHHAANQFLLARDLMPDEPSKNELATAAIAKLEASLATHAYEEFAHFNLGWLYLDRGEPALAVRHFTTAARLVPDKSGVYFGLGLALRALGRPEAAIRAFAVEWISFPFSITAPVWESPEFARLKPAVQAELFRLYAQLAPVYPRAAGAEAWSRWWLGEPVSPDALREGLIGPQVDFAAALPQIEARMAVPGNAGWQKLYRAWLQPEAAERWQELLPKDPALATAIQRRAQKEQGSFAAFLRAPVGDAVDLTHTYRAMRAGYGVRALHPDGPPLFDVYLTQENRFLARCASDLFPPRGWLPPRFLLPLLPSTAGILKPAGN